MLTGPVPHVAAVISEFPYWRCHEGSFSGADAGGGGGGGGADTGQGRHTTGLDRTGNHSNYWGKTSSLWAANPKAVPSVTRESAGFRMNVGAIVPVPAETLFLPQGEDQRVGVLHVGVLPGCRRGSSELTGNYAAKDAPGLLNSALFP